MGCCEGRPEKSSQDQPPEDPAVRSSPSRLCVPPHCLCESDLRIPGFVGQLLEEKRRNAAAAAQERQKKFGATTKTGSATAGAGAGPKPVSSPLLCSCLLRAVATCAPYRTLPLRSPPLATTCHPYMPGWLFGALFRAPHKVVTDCLLGCRQQRTMHESTGSQKQAVEDGTDDGRMLRKMQH